jgi:ribosome recycling factor
MMAGTSDIIKEHSDLMAKSVANLARAFASVRTGRASAAMLEHINVDYYGTPTPITQIASVKSPEAHLLVVEPWDKNVLKEMEKALQASDLGITPSNDGTMIRLPFPPPTEERRKELVKQCRNLAEEARVAVRNIRRDANAKLERMTKDEDLPKDEAHRAEEAIQKATDQHIAQIDADLKAKEAEVMEI